MNIEQRRLSPVTVESLITSLFITWTAEVLPSSHCDTLVKNAIWTNCTLQKGTFETCTKGHHSNTHDSKEEPTLCLMESFIRYRSMHATNRVELLSRPHHVMGGNNV